MGRPNDIALARRDRGDALFGGYVDGVTPGDGSAPEDHRLGSRSFYIAIAGRSIAVRTSHPGGPSLFSGGNGLLSAYPTLIDRPKDPPAGDDRPLRYRP